MLEIILGTSGSGKTVAVYEKIADCATAGKEVILLVPEQYSFESERTLFDRIGAELMTKVEVFSFKRLANAVFKKYGGISAEVINETGKLFIMSAALYQLSDSLDFYAKKASNPNSISAVSDLVAMVDELKNACVTAEMLRNAAEQVDAEGKKTTLGSKVKELALIMESYCALLDAAGSDSADDLVRACRFLAEDNFFEGKKIYIDSFNDFTADEFLMLEYMISGAESVTVALECDSIYDELDGCGLFSIVQKTAQKLIRKARKEGVQVAAPEVCRAGRRFLEPTLAHLEQNLLRAKQVRYNGEAKGIKLVAAQNCYDEFEFVAAEIRKLVAENGYRYKDIAVIARNAAAYGDAVSAAFKKYSIPFFFDKRTAIASKPLITLMICAVRTAAEGYSSELLMRLAKTGLAGLDVEEIGKLEDYVYIWGINGGRWKRDFTEDPFGFEGGREDSKARLEEINALRHRLISPLEKLREAVEGCDGEGFAVAVYAYLKRLEISEQLEKLAQQYEDIGEKEFADELEPLWELTVSLLEQFAVTLKGVCLPEKRFAELFRLAAAKADIAAIPHTVDQVIVGAADRIRTGTVKAVFVVGVNEGEFPAVYDQSGILTAEDRRELSKCGIDIAEQWDNRPLFERLFLYNAVTCSSERVYISYKKQELEGKLLQPSAVIRQITGIFPSVTVENTAVKNAAEDIWNNATAFEIYVAGRRDKSSQFISSLREYLLTEAEFAGRTRHLDGVFKPQNFKIADKETAQKLIGKKLRLAPSNVERYFDCRFKYFCYDCLRLKKKRKAEMSPLETGTLIHHVLENMLAAHQPKELAVIEFGELKNQVEQLLSGYLEENLGGSVEKTARFVYLYERLKDGIIRLLRRIGDEFENSDFVPAAFELAIKENSPQVKSVKLYTKEGTEVVVEGYVDRVDVMEKDGKRYVRVVDYKSGGKKFNLADVYYGLNMQMLIYLFSIQRQGSGVLADAIPAGVLYLPADGSVISVERKDSEEEIVEKSRKHYKMNGLLLNDMEAITGMDRDHSGKFIPASFSKNGTLYRAEVSPYLATAEEMGKICRHIDGLITDMAQALSDGEVCALPMNSGSHLACDFCDYSDICRRTADSPERDMLAIKSKNDFYSAIDGETQEKGGAEDGQKLD
ncbi:MAG: PD-(D/E)XK nuclease family protein [Oscillospiraceae bacterium]|nr:PD-(D/E)XK nuclease family protein [Oscillospiraceae bacterium]